MTAKVKQIVVDHGWLSIMKEIGRMDKSFTKVGLPQEGKIEPNTSTGITEMSELVEVAAVHEFGSPKNNIPVRSFVRSSADENRAAIKNIQQAEINRIVGGKSTVSESLKRIGEFMKSKMQAKIRKGPFAALQPSTIAARKREFGKASSRPLIATGQMIQSIQHVEVVNG